MGCTIGALRAKIMEMYPEIERNGVLISLRYNKEKSTYFVNFSKGRKVFATHLQKKEADEFMDGIKFVFLGSQIGRWMNNFVANQTQTTDMLSAQGARHQEPDHGRHRGPGIKEEELWATP